MRRLLDRQYRNAVRDLLGPEAAAAAQPPADIASQQMEAIGASELSLSGTAVRQYEDSARAIAAAARVAGTFAPHHACSPSGPQDEACFRAFVTAFGRKAWRRALEPEEVDRWTSVALGAAAGLGTFEEGVEHAAAGMLQSPNFLFQVEVGSGRRDRTKGRLTGYEIATRLSFFLNDTTPDEALLAAAESGALDTAEGVRAAAAVLLERPAAREALRAFWGERFRVREVAALQKDPTAYPGWSAALAFAMQEEAYRLLDDVVWERDVDWKELLAADYAFVDADLAAHYGVDPPASGFARVDLPAVQGRAGVLTQGATMALLAHPVTTSPTRRGKFVQERFLCREILPPPPDVDVTLPPDPPDGPETMRQKLERHQTDPACASCHAQMDPLGFALEHFDATGAWRADDQGLPIDDTGEVTGIGAFDGAAGLAALLGTDPAVDRCLVRALYRQGTGHRENTDESTLLEALDVAFATNGGRVKILLLDLVASELFRSVGASEPLLHAEAP